MSGTRGKILNEEDLRTLVYIDRFCDHEDDTKYYTLYKPKVVKPDMRTLKVSIKPDYLYDCVNVAVSFKDNTNDKHKIEFTFFTLDEIKDTIDILSESVVHSLVNISNENEEEPPF